MAKLKTKLIALTMSLVTLTLSPLSAFKASAESKGKYVSEVFIAYGKTEDDARKWLEDHGWEPVDGNFNKGKESDLDKNEKVATVMGIHRTNDPKEAITDMAVMNMGVKGKEGYSFSDYKALVEMKRAEIDEFLDCFTPVLQEYRANVTGKGSASGKARADLAKELLNKFYDGEPATKEDEKKIVHDTGKPLGDLFIEQTRREMGDDAYEKDRGNHADLEQIILESSGAAVTAVEQALAMATDTAETTWLERLSKISLETMKKNPGAYVDSAKGQELAPSAALQVLNQKYGDAAKTLAADYDTIQQEMIWYETYMDNATDEGLWQGDDESDEDYAARLEAYFEQVKTDKGEDAYEEEFSQYGEAFKIYALLYSVDFKGAWGDTLGDFFNPADEKNYGENPDNFLPFAAALSDGQRAGLEFLDLYSLLQIGVGSEEAAKQTLPDISEFFKDKESISVYTGINRNIFRGGVALTSEAMMHQNLMQDDPYDIWDVKNLENILIYSMAALGFCSLVTSLALTYEYVNVAINDRVNFRNVGWFYNKEKSEFVENLKAYIDSGDDVREELNGIRSGMAARWLTVIGGALMVGAAVWKLIQYGKSFQRTFTPIPMMIVDEADIVSYVTDEKGKPVLDENGEQVKEIKFDQYVYYDVVRCNRQEVGNIGDWQDGVDKYASEEWGCGDANDLNGDYGKQWLALYTVKSEKKGNPILADSLKLQYGSSKQPEGTTKKLHFFCYDFAMNIADQAYCFNDKKGGIYFFWDEDTKAFASNTASTFSGGMLALTGIGGLALGILGTTVVMMMKKKKEEQPETPAAA